MNCLNHPETPAVAYCRSCGKPLCAACKHTAQGVIYCAEHAPAPAAEPESPYTAPAPPPSPVFAHPECSPAIACLLGFIPGVGAIYNGQYAKGLVHAVIFGLLISIAESGAGGLGPMFGILIAVWFFYMAIEAYHTCRKRRAGEPVDEFSSIIDLRGRSGTFPTAAVTLIALGVILLMDTMGLLRFRDVARYWPVLLILAGVYMLYLRIGSGDGTREARDERH